MKIQKPTGTTIDLAEVADFKVMQGSVTLLREDQQPQMNVTTDIVDRDQGGIVADVETQLEAMNLPEGYHYNIGGEAEDMADSFADLALSLVFLIFLVFSVIDVLFE